MFIMFLIVLTTPVPQRGGRGGAGQAASSGGSGAWTWNGTQWGKWTFNSGVYGFFAPATQQPPPS